MVNFNQLISNELLVKALKVQSICEPTKIQEQVIPLILAKKDIIACSETGSGKTLAYLLPIIANIDLDSKLLQAIILTPTHELAIQVERQIKTLIQNSKIDLRASLIIGNINISRQLEKLKQKPHIIVGSAGRIIELLSKKKISGHSIKTVVIDEADRMIDSKNISDVKSIIKTTLKDRQIVMFSATMPDKSIKVAKEFMKEPVIVKLKNKELLPDTINHIYFVSERRDKIEILRKIIKIENPQKVIVFINDPNSIETTIEKLEYHKLKATGIYGLANKIERKKAMDSFRLGKTQILVSSDLGSRGLDIDGVTHIISLDIPEEPTLYLHRAGRTGRAGKKGCSISIVTQGEEQWLRKYEKQFNIKISKKDISYGKINEVKYGDTKKNDSKNNFSIKKIKHKKQDFKNIKN